jgi:hypothetical protein
MAKPNPLVAQPDLVEHVLDRMADGEILTSVCRELGLRPSAFSLLANHDEAFAARYARARLEQAAAVADDVVSVVDRETDPTMSQLAIARSNARKWLASRLDPAKFGDKPAQVNVSVSLRDMIRQSATIEHEAAPGAMADASSVEHKPKTGG